MEHFQNKKIAVLGYGLEGQCAARYFLKHGADVTICDEKESLGADVPEGCRVRLGAGAFDHLEDFDMVSRTPPLRPDRLSGAAAITSVTNEFFANWHGRMIGVTGTKGKGTTTTLAARILEEAGYTAPIVGNIGTPALDILDDLTGDEIICYELSSFQLWDVQKSPPVAIVLMMETDHQDVHRSVEEYLAAKQNIGRFQKADDVMIYHPNNEMSAGIAEVSPAQHRRYLVKGEGAYIENNVIKIDDTEICPVDEVGLRGEHNLENITAAVTAAWVYTQDSQAVARAVKAFSGLPHRLELVVRKDGIEYFDDSFATTPATARAAIRAFSDADTAVILGGHDKGADFSSLAQTVIDEGVRGVIAIGTTGPAIARLLRDKGYGGTIIEGLTDMRDMVRAARDLLNGSRQGIVLLSPGCASFGLFDNYKQRGELFAAAARDL